MKGECVAAGRAGFFLFKKSVIFLTISWFLHDQLQFLHDQLIPLWSAHSFMNSLFFHEQLIPSWTADSFMNSWFFPSFSFWQLMSFWIADIFKESWFHTKKIWKVAAGSKINSAMSFVLLSFVLQLFVLQIIKYLHIHIYLLHSIYIEHWIY